MQEIWKVYTKTKGPRWGSIVWEVSNWGRVKKNGVLHEPGCSSTGYKWFAMTYVHRAVAQVFIPNLENKPQVNHIDGDKANNHVTNLEWVTASENIKHSYATGLNKRRYLTMDQAREIRSLYAKGYRCSQIAKKYNVIYHVVWGVVKNKNYKEEA